MNKRQRKKHRRKQRVNSLAERLGVSFADALKGHGKMEQEMPEKELTELFHKLIEEVAMAYQIPVGYLLEPQKGEPSEQASASKE